MNLNVVSNLKKFLGFKEAGVQAEARPMTGGYTSFNYTYWHQPRDLPLFDFWSIHSMLRDSQVKLCLMIRSAPLFGVEFAYKDGDQWKPGVQSDRPEVGAFVDRQIKRIWHNHLSDIVNAQIWGWTAAEVCLKLGASNLLEVNRMEFRRAEDIRLLKQNGQPAAVQFLRVADGNGEVSIKFPEAFFHAHDPEPGDDYGNSILRGAWSPWCDKWLSGGALDVRRTFMHRDAYGGTDLGYPDGHTFVDGNPVPNRDIARDIMDKIRSGYSIARPSERDEKGNEKWPLQRAVIASNPAHILQYPKDLDDEIRQGIGIPDGVIDDTGGGAWAGKRIPMSAFYSSLDSWITNIVRDLKEQVLEPLVMFNFGEAVDFDVRHKPLAEQAMEQQGSAGGGMQPQQPMGGGMDAMQPGDDQTDPMAAMLQGQPQPGEGEDNPFMMSVDRILKLSAERTEEKSQSQAIADILQHVFGDDAEAMAEELLSDVPKKMAAGRRWNSLDHPRGPDGRFIEKNSPEAVSAAKSAVRSALSGKRTPQKFKQIAENLSILTAAQIRSVAKEYGVKAGGAKQQLVDKVTQLLTGQIVDTDDSEIEDLTTTTTRDDFTPVNPVNRDVYTVPTDSIHADPDRFQYKVKDIGKEGVSGELKSVAKWNPELGGVLLVWRDPENGQDYVVNGHHRLHLAKRLGAEDLNVRYIDASNAKVARAAGALANIAEGRGSAIDAAKYLRDSGQTVEHLKNAGVSLSGRVAADAMVLVDLADRPFQRVTQGVLEEDTAIAVAKHLKDHDLQNKLFKKLDYLEDDGKSWSKREIETAAKKMANSGTVESQGGGLFADWDDEESTFDSEVALESHVSRMLSMVANDFKSVASVRRADRVAEAGNVLEVEENARRAKAAQAAADVFSKEANLKGPVADAIKYHALDYHRAKTKADRDRIKAEALESVRDAIADTLTSKTVTPTVPGMQTGLFAEDPDGQGKLFNFMPPDKSRSAFDYGTDDVGIKPIERRANLPGQGALAMGLEAAE